MNKIKILLFAICLPALLPAQDVPDPVKYVDPFIGTAAHGHTYPGAALPFGMVQMSPDNGTSGWDWCSGYNYADSNIIGFSHTHLSGTGIGDLLDIRLMPALVTETGTTLEKIRSSFSNADESASPGYYSVFLDSYKIKAELTVSRRAAIQRYSYPEDGDAAVLLDLATALNWDNTTAAYIKVVDDSTVSGYRFSKGWAADQRVYFTVKFSSPFHSYAFYENDTIISADKESGGKLLKLLLKFKDLGGSKLLVKSAISSSGIDGADKNLQSGISGWDFDAVRDAALKVWRGELGKIKVTGSEEKKKIFYTALYHSLLTPNLYSDVDGAYGVAGGRTFKAPGYDRYTVFSLWDTFRALHPLLTIIKEDIIADLINSMLGHYKETGLLPVWELYGNETNTMIGYHAIPVITDAILKGVPGFDVNLAYEAMKASAMQDAFGIDGYKKLGYVPADKENESVSKTLEYAYDDWCIAKAAGYLNKEDDYNYFLSRSKSYINLFDKDVLFMRGRESGGAWVKDFNPRYVNHREDEYTEGNAWQWTWFVPHDIEGLINLFGSRERFIQKLDSLFNQKPLLEGTNVSPDISGMIGQYAHGNEPSHHIAYIYNFAGEPRKTQELTRRICEELYTAGRDGLCGNDDCGQMSAWYIFSSMGLYPVNPADGNYSITSPLFDKTEINLPGGKVFTITADGLSEENKYIESIELNGSKLNRLFITHKELMAGGVLLIRMSK